MAHFKKAVLTIIDQPAPVIPEAIDFVVKDLDFSVCHLDLALRPLRKAPIEPSMIEGLEMCLKFIATSAILLRTKYCREIWDIEDE